MHVNRTKYISPECMDYTELTLFRKVSLSQQEKQVWKSIIFIIFLLMSALIYTSLGWGETYLPCLCSYLNWTGRCVNCIWIPRDHGQTGAEVATELQEMGAMKDGQLQTELLQRRPSLKYQVRRWALWSGAEAGHLCFCPSKLKPGFITWLVCVLSAWHRVPHRGGGK